MLFLDEVKLRITETIILEIGTVGLVILTSDVNRNNGVDCPESQNKNVCYSKLTMNYE